MAAVIAAGFAAFYGPGRAVEKSYLLRKVLSLARHSSPTVATSSDLLAKEVRRLFAASDRSSQASILGLTDAFGGGSMAENIYFHGGGGRWTMMDDGGWRKGIMYYSYVGIDRQVFLDLDFGLWCVFPRTHLDVFLVGNPLRYFL